MTAEINRRGAVRVTDRVLLACNRVTPEKFQAIAADYQHGISLYNQAGLADIQMYIGAESALGRIRERDADLADFLKHLDNKLNQVLQRVQNEPTPFDALKPQKVNLSGNGLAFPATEEYGKGELLEVHLVLLPAYSYIYGFARVVGCGQVAKNQENPLYRVGVEFVLLTDEDREKLIQHNFRQQSLALRNRRQEKI